MRIFTGARLFDGERFRDDSALVVEDDRVRAIVAHADRPGGETVDLAGGVLAPGFVDWQVNGGGGALFNQAPDPQTIRRIVVSHRAYGTTALLPTVITDAPDALSAALAAAREAQATIPGALGVHVEGPFIDARRKGAHPAEWIRPLREADAAALIDARAGVMVVTLAPASASNEMIARLARAGIIVSIGHAEASAEEAQAAFDAGARAATHLYNAMSQLGHRSPGLVGAALANPRVYCGFIADGFHVHETAGRIALRAKGAERIALISDAMPSAAGGPKQYELHGRRVTQSGLKLTLEDGTLAGAAITMLDAIRYCVAHLGAPLGDALRMATLTPAQLLRIEASHGSLRPGARADLVHLGPDLELFGVWVGGEAVQLE
ncbi:MAG: N-acetylglucosamine-6-phosphate deacetylase [Bradyrhizobium sp.]|nr:MAG: N-acetylglucosamine-6-phosphate deacetylase [Bradyrhizobium sp.]